MAKFPFSQIGNAGVAYLLTLSERNGPRYLHAAEELVSYAGTTYAAVAQDLAANHVALRYNTDPEHMPVSDELKAAAESYGDAREAAQAAKKARRKGRSQ